MPRFAICGKKNRPIKKTKLHSEWAYYSSLSGKGHYYDQNPQVGVLFKYLLLGKMTDPKPKALQCMLPGQTQGWNRLQLLTETWFPNQLYCRLCFLTWDGLTSHRSILMLNKVVLNFCGSAMSGIASLQLTTPGPEVWWQVFCSKQEKCRGDEMRICARLWKYGDRWWCTVLGRHMLMSARASSDGSQQQGHLLPYRL